MKALTLHQPWATLLVMGLKTVETRSWKAWHNGPMLIHASRSMRFIGDQTFMEKFYQRAGIVSGWARKELTFPVGAIIGSVDYYASVPVADIKGTLSREQLALGDFAEGRFAWLFHRHIKFERSYPCRGYQGLWTVPKEIEQQLQGGEVGISSAS